MGVGSSFALVRRDFFDSMLGLLRVVGVVAVGELESDDDECCDTLR